MAQAILEVEVERDEINVMGAQMKLLNFCELIVDCEHKTAPTQAEGYPSIRTPNIGRGRFILEGVNRVSEETYKAWTKRAVPAPGDLIMAREAPVGNVAMVPHGLTPCLGQRTLLIRPEHRKIDAAYLTYLLLSPQVQTSIHAKTNGATVAHLNMKDVRELELPSLPPLSEQRRIAGILSAYDDLIENCERRIRVLDEMARALYREWFVSMRPDSRATLAQQLVDDGVLEINDGYRAKNSELGHPGLPFARAGNIDAGFHFDDADALAEANLSRAGTKVSKPGDIVFTSKGTVGRFAKVRERTPRFVYSPQLCFWRVLRPELLSPNYLFRWMQGREFMDQVDSVKGSTDMADYVSLTNQRRMTVHVPPVATQRRAEAALRPIDDLIGTLTDRRGILRKTRDLLLPRLLSGQLTVEDAA